MDRIPKKVGVSMVMEPGELPNGWGVQIVEGLNTAFVTSMFFTYTCVMFVLTVTWVVVKKDSAEGPGLGSLAVAVGAIIATFVVSRYYQKIEA